ncbi:hypothetical protein LIT25_28085 (plasmid) [Bacillus sp. F19]|nr:hypothetical protein LIT25_28085 [Bacillus sp. F19]
MLSSEGKLLVESGGDLQVGQFKCLPFELDGGAAGKDIDLEITGALRDGYWRIVSLIMMP